MERSRRVAAFPIAIRVMSLFPVKGMDFAMALSFHRAVPVDAEATSRLCSRCSIKLVLISAFCLELNRQLQTRRKEVVTPMPMGKALMLQECLSTTSICTKFMERLLPQGLAKASFHFCCF